MKNVFKVMAIYQNQSRNQIDALKKSFAIICFLNIFDLMIPCGFRLQSARNYFQNHEKFIGMAVF